MDPTEHANDLVRKRRRAVPIGNQTRDHDESSCTAPCLFFQTLHLSAPLSCKSSSRHHGSLLNLMPVIPTSLLPTSRILPSRQLVSPRASHNAFQRRGTAPVPLKCWGFGTAGFRQRDAWTPPGLDVSVHAHSAIPPPQGLFNPANDRDRSGDILCPCNIAC